LKLNQLKLASIFKSEEDESEFWLRHCLSEYIDLSKPIKVEMPNLKRSSLSERQQ
jgi:hypothetical protein